MRRVDRLLVGLSVLMTAACGAPESLGAARSAALGPEEPLIARWWQWTESVPAAHNPIDDPDGADCGLAQPADVWFLAGTHGGRAERTCSVPRDVPVFFPVLNTVCVLEQGESATEAVGQCQSAVDVATAALDGRPLPVVETASRTSFPLATPGGGGRRAVTWGLWVGPVPLSPGSHTLVLEGRAGSFDTAVTYHLTVAGGDGSSASTSAPFTRTWPDRS